MFICDHRYLQIHECTALDSYSTYQQCYGSADYPSAFGQLISPFVFLVESVLANLFQPVFQWFYFFVLCNSESWFEQSSRLNKMDDNQNQRQFMQGSYYKTVCIFSLFRNHIHCSISHIVQRYFAESIVNARCRADRTVQHFYFTFCRFSLIVQQCGNARKWSIVNSFPLILFILEFGFYAVSISSFIILRLWISVSQPQQPATMHEKS